MSESQSAKAYRCIYIITYEKDGSSKFIQGNGVSFGRDPQEAFGTLIGAIKVFDDGEEIKNTVGLRYELIHIEQIAE